MRVLFLTTLLPAERRTGSEVASRAFVDGLRSLGHAVTVLGYRRAGAAPAGSAGDVAVAERHIETATAGIRAAGWMGRALLRREAYSVSKYRGRRYRRALRRALAEGGPQLVIVDHAQSAWLVPASGWPVAHVYLAHNVEHRLYAELSRGGGARGRVLARESRLIGAAERGLCRSAAAVWALTAEDAVALADLGGSVRCFDLPAARVPDPPGPPEVDVALLGTWTWRPNAAGLEWYLDDVQPRLPAGLRVELGGAASERFAEGRPGVTGRGRVPDALAFLQAARVVAVPAVAGAGVQVKTLDAIASGRVVVATSVGLRGIVDPPDTVRVADEPGAFARALTQAAAARDDPAVAREARAWVLARAERFAAQLEEAVRAA